MAHYSQSYVTGFQGQSPEYIPLYICIYNTEWNILYITTMKDIKIFFLFKIQYLGIFSIMNVTIGLIF